MEAGEAGVPLGQLVVVRPQIHRAVEVAEQLGNRLDLLVVGAGRREQRLGLGDVAGLNRVGEGPGLLDQRLQRLGDVDLVLGDRRHQGQGWTSARTGRRGADAAGPPGRGMGSMRYSSVPRWLVRLLVSCDARGTFGRLRRRAAEIVLGRRPPAA